MFTLHVNSAGDVVRLLDEHGNAHKFHVEGECSDEEEDEQADPEDSNARVVNRLVSSKRANVVTKIADIYEFEKAVCTVGTSQLPDRCFPTGVVFKLECGQQPKLDAFPVDFSFGSGITLVEISHPDHFLSTSFFTSERLAEAKDALLVSSPAPIGVVDDASVLEYMLQYTSPQMENDPFLTMWEGDETETPLGAKTFVGIFVSNWSTVQDCTQEEFGHDVQQPSHFYLLVRDSLPDETCDQLRHMVRYRSQVDQQTWDTIATAKEFKRAREIGEKARRHKIDCVCRSLGVTYKEDRVSITNTDMFAIQANEEEDLTSPNVFFYSGCSSSLEVGPGRAILANNGVDPPDAIWLHGPSNGRLGGGQWRTDENFNGFPETINAVHEDNIGALVASGWDVTNGFVHLVHVAVIHAGARVPVDIN
jgi:hypothetical protein